MKGLRPASQLRRKPHQARSRATYDAIIYGAARVLGRLGLDGFNTNSVAAAAGVSIGSLYQYFANKDELLESLTSHHFESLKTSITSSINHFAHAPIEVMVTGVIESILHLQHGDQEVFRAIRDHLPRSNPLNRTDEMLDYVTNIVTITLATRQNELGLADPGRTAFLLVHTVDGVLQGVLRKGTIDTDINKAVEEISEIVLLYLNTHPNKLK